MSLFVLSSFCFTSAQTQVIDMTDPLSGLALILRKKSDKVNYCFIDAEYKYQIVLVVMSA